MNQKRQRWIYYAKGLLALVPVTMTYYFFPQLFVPCFAILVGFLWNFAIDTPGVKTRVRARRYRFSFLRGIYKIDQWCMILLAKLTAKKWLRSLARTLLPVIPFAALYLLTYTLHPLWIWLGACYYLLWEQGLKCFAFKLKK